MAGVRTVPLRENIMQPTLLALERSSIMPDRKGARRFGKPRKPAPYEESRKCVTCGKMLPVGVRYCVSCGTHDAADLDSRVADVDVQLERRRERNAMLWFLQRISFGLWRF